MSSLLDAARRLRPAQDMAENCYECGYYGDSDNPHAADCPYRALPKIVAALEAAERVAETEPIEPACDSYDEPCCVYCTGDMDMRGPRRIRHVAGCPWRALLAALKGEPTSVS